MILNKNFETFRISDMLKPDQKKARDQSKHQGYISGICFLIVFSAAFFLIWNVLSRLEEQYYVKLLEFQSLENLTTYDIRADIYAILNASTSTVNAFDEEVTINDNRIYLDETGEIFIERGD